MCNIMLVAYATHYFFYTDFNILTYWVLDFISVLHWVYVESSIIKQDRLSIMTRLIKRKKILRQIKSNL